MQLRSLKKKKDFFPEEFKNLLNQLFDSNPRNRPSFADIRANAWYKDDDVATLKEV